jgi:hypothetical protein
MLNFTTNINDKMTLGMYFVTFGTVISSTNCNLILYLFYFEFMHVFDTDDHIL